MPFTTFQLSVFLTFIADQLLDPRETNITSRLKIIVNHGFMVHVVSCFILEYPKSGTLTDPQRISDSFNEYDVNIGSDLSNKLDHPNSDTFEQYLKTPTNQSCKFEEVTGEDILTILNKLLQFECKNRCTENMFSHSRQTFKN